MLEFSGKNAGQSSFGLWGRNICKPNADMLHMQLLKRANVAQGHIHTPGFKTCSARAAGTLREILDIMKTFVFGLPIFLIIITRAI